MLEDIAKFLHAKGIGKYNPVGTDGNIFVCMLPNDPDNVLSVYPAPGLEADPKLGYDSTGVQIITRHSTDPVLGYSNAKAAHDALNGFSRGYLTPGGTYVVLIYAVQSNPVYIDKDDGGRHEWSSNFIVEIKNKTTYRE